LILAPFISPPIANAQSSSDTPTPACEFNLSTNKPGLFCEPQKIEFKPGDSNAAIEERKREEERQHQLAIRRAQAARAQAQYVRETTVDGTSDDVIKLYPESGQCVPFARDVSGITISGTARNVSVNSSEPHVGDILISYDSSAGHASVVVAIEGDHLRVRDRNWIPGWVTEHLVPINSSRIKGFVTKSS